MTADDVGLRSGVESGLSAPTTKKVQRLKVSPHVIRLRNETDAEFSTPQAIPIGEERSSSCFWQVVDPRLSRGSNAKTTEKREEHEMKF